ncbi:MAG TPA: hypothetical protein ENH94_11890 [Phycisphaerales bacterium]|nr:hypothetical protein [Phycisphaerales bacterium]
MDSDKTSNTGLPSAAIEYIDAVIKKMRYCKKIRAEVRSELIAHFEDALKNCEDELRQERCKELIEEFGDIKLLGVLLRRGKKRCRAGWRTAIVRVFQSIAILFLGLILYCIYISFAQPNIRVDYIEEMANINRPVDNENLNAAVLYQKAIDDFVESPKIEREIEFGILEGFGMIEPTGDEQSQTEEVDLLTAIDDKLWIGDMAEKEINLLRQWIADNDKAIEYFLTGSQKPHCWWERKLEGWAIKAPTPELSPMKDMVKLVCWRAKLKASGGEIEAGLNDLLKCYKAGEHFKGPQILISQLVGMSMQKIVVKSSRAILSNVEVDSERLKAFQKEFEVMQAGGIYVTDYKVERFFFLDLIQRIYTDNGKGGGRMIPQGPMLDDEKSLESYSDSLLVSLISADRRDMTLEFEKLFQTGERWAKMTPWQLRNSDEDLSIGERWSWIKQIRYSPVLAITLTQHLQKVCEVSYHNRVEVEALIATIAILRYEKEKTEYPESLDVLITEGYLKQLPMDPFSDGPLVYRVTDNDFILYSFGPNFIDDGGEYGIKKGKFKQWTNNSDAVFWPVWRDEN